MKNIFIFLLIPFLISALDEALKSAIYYMSKNGLQFLSTTGRFGQNLNDEFAWMVEDFLGPPSIASSVKAINNLRKEIISRLDEIEENIKLSKKDILNEIRGSNYVNGFGKSLDSLLVQINDLVDGFNANDNSKELTENEKIVENSFLIGNNADWIKEGNIIFNLKNLALVLSGQTFSDFQNRDLYQVLYDLNLKDWMFSGEIYDAFEPYIQKVLGIYFYGCSVILKGLKNSQFMTNFTETEIKDLSASVYNHYKSSAIASTQHILNQIKFISDKVFNISNKDSVISHYGVFIYKKKYQRNIFVNFGKISPIPIADSLGNEILYYSRYRGPQNRKGDLFGYAPALKHMLDYTKEVYRYVEGILRKNVLTHKQMEELFNYYNSPINDNYRKKNYGFISFIHDKNIDSKNLLEKQLNSYGYISFPLPNNKNNEWSAVALTVSDSEILTSAYHCLGLGKAFCFDYNPCRKQCEVFGFKNVDSVLTGYTTTQRPFIFRRGEIKDAPSTAKEMMILENITFNNSSEEKNEDAKNNTPIIINENYTDLKGAILLFSKYNNTNNNESDGLYRFKMQFTAINKNIISPVVKFPVNIEYKNNLRNLDRDEETLTYCIINQLENNIYDSTCNILKYEEEINNIEVIPKFNFFTDENISLNFTPLADSQNDDFMNNIEDFDFSSFNFYILENSTIIKENNTSFYIVGTINDPKLTFNDYIKLTLSVFNDVDENQDEEDDISDINCKLIFENNNTYILNCKTNETVDLNLDFGISIINNDTLLLIVFENSSSYIELGDNYNRYNRYNIKKNNRNLGTAGIILIVIIPIIAIISVIASIFLIKDNNHKSLSNDISNSNNSLQNLQAS